MQRTVIPEILGALTGIGIAAILYFVWPDAKFLTVERLDIIDREVVVSRSIQGAPKTIADWRVTIVKKGSDQPVCQTVPGDKLHQGWSIYSTSKNQVRRFSMSEWVGDPACHSRLKDGPYDMFVTWTPRDGRDPVAHHKKFYW